MDAYQNTPVYVTLPDVSSSPKQQIVIASGGAVNVESGGQILAAGVQGSSSNLADSTGGTPGTTLAALGGTTYATDGPVIMNSISSLAAQLNAVITILKNLGASS